MIGGGFQQVDAARIVSAAGLRVIVSDRNERAPAFRFADESWVVDGRDTSELSSRAIEAREHGLAGVFTLTELVESVAHVAEAAGLPGVSPDAARACQDKSRAKKLWVGRGIATARAGVVADLDKARALFCELGEAAFLKPCTGAGGLGASSADSMEQLETAFANAIDVDDRVLIEERLMGTHHDVNGIFDEHGEFHSAGLADRSFALDAPVELTASAPTVLSEKQQRRALELTRDAALALGIRFGPVKSDLILTQSGFRILELAPRLHGPKGTLHLLPLAFGFHPLIAALRVMTGMSLRDQDLRPKHKRAALIVAIPPSPGCVLKAIGGLQEASALPGIQGVRILMKLGTEMRSPKSNADIVGHVFSAAPDMQAARYAADRAMDRIELITDQTPRD